MFLIPTGGDAIKKCVKNTDSKVIDHLYKVFRDNMFFHTGRNGNLICPCIKANVPFRVTAPLEYSLTPDGSAFGVLKTGIYEITYHNINGPVHSIRLKRFDKKGATIIDEVYAGWENDNMINWSVVFPVQGELSF